MTAPIRTRFAPSPTGYLHIGGARTALFSWLYARKHQGTFILRIEDTDRERSTDEAVKAILEGMNWLGLQHDEGPFYQTLRFDRYRSVMEQLIHNGHAYYCYCSKDELEQMRAEQMANKQKPRYNGYWRDRQDTPLSGVEPVVRFKNPLDGEVVIDDQIRGRIIIKNTELDDLIIARSDGTPTYNFTVVVDDMDMGVTHVIRGDDHINNTPRQINILRALGANIPVYAHVPMILGPDGQRLSKRHGAVSVMQYRDEGFLPQALLNYLVRLGWSHGDQEVFSLEEMIAKFDIHDVNKAAAAVNPDKLLWLNQHYLKTIPVNDIAQHLQWHLNQQDIIIQDSPKLETVIEILRERSKTLVDMARQIKMFYHDITDYEPSAVEKHFKADALSNLRRLHAVLNTQGEWCAETIHATLSQLATELGVKMGIVAQPLRVALSGGSVSPPIDKTAELLGKQTCITRIEHAIAFIQQARPVQSQD